MSQRHSTPPSLDDLLLAARQRGGDVDAWRVLVAQLTPRLYRVARGLTAWRVLGAQTIVEHAWRAAIRSPGVLDDGATLRSRLLTEVVGRALALGDSPRDQPPDDESPARLAAMRAVALLPYPSRAVLVLADIGGLPLPEVASLLSMPEARLKAELWHARLAVDTLRGAGVGTAPTPPALVAVDALPAPDGPSGDDAGVAALWREPVPDELLDRLAHDLHDRRQRRRLAHRATGRRLPMLGGLLAIVIIAVGAALWRELPGLAHGLPERPASSAAAPARSPGGVALQDSTRVGVVLRGGAAVFARPTSPATTDAPAAPDRRASQAPAHSAG